MKLGFSVASFALAAITATAAATATAADNAELGACGVTSPSVNVFDDTTPSIQFVEPKPDAVVPSDNVRFVVKISSDFDFAPDEALNPAQGCYGAGDRVPNRGHYHLYLTRAGSTAVEHFTAPDSQAVARSLDPGTWCAYADLTHNDHTQRFKANPRDLPPFDKVCFFVLGPRGEDRERFRVSGDDGS
jgi:hypothetical protein